MKSLIQKLSNIARKAWNGRLTCGHKFGQREATFSQDLTPTAKEGGPTLKLSAPLLPSNPTFLQDLRWTKEHYQKGGAPDKHHRREVGVPTKMAPCLRWLDFRAVHKSSPQHLPEHDPHCSGKHVHSGFWTWGTQGCVWHECTKLECKATTSHKVHTNISKCRTTFVGS